jgi:hypothetical protein
MSDEIKNEAVVEVKPTGELTTAKLDEVVGGAPLVEGGLVGECRDKAPIYEPQWLINGM